MPNFYSRNFFVLVILVFVHAYTSCKRLKGRGTLKSFIVLQSNGDIWSVLNVNVITQIVKLLEYT